jgi:predicted TIM-barrel fold metal-dependent hydrolase
MKIGGMGMPVLGFGFERREAPASAAEMAQVWQSRIDVCIDAFGTDRCMFESNYPVDKQSGSYCELWNAFKLATQGASPEGAQRPVLSHSMSNLPPARARGLG